MLRKKFAGLLASDLNHLYDMNMSTILISEFITSQALDSLRSVHQVVYEPELHQDREALIAAMQNIDALIVRNLTQVNEEILRGSSNLKVLVAWVLDLRILTCQLALNAISK